MTRRPVALLVMAVCVTAICACETPAERDAPAEPPATTDERVAEVNLVFGGDVMFGRWRDGAWHEHHNADIFQRLEVLTGEADFAAANLETALCPPEISRTARPGDAVQLTAPPESVARLANAGIDLVAVANNHALDCGPTSLSLTESALSKSGMLGAGIAPVEFSLGETDARIIVVAATLHPPRTTAGAEQLPHVVPLDEFGTLVDHIARLRKERARALVVVSLHWGAEHAPSPSRWQRDHARKLVDAGADIIWGHGTHTVQPIERHKDGVIAYSLGNLHFDMERRGTQAREMLRVKVVMEDGERPRIAKVGLVPIAGDR